LVVLLVLAFSTFACDGDRSLVALSAKVQDPALSVHSSSVGADATGSFDLVLALGEYADDETQVSLGSFAIQRGDMELLSPLALSGAKFPVSLGIGKKVELAMTFDASPDPGMADELCQGSVTLRGTLTDSLSNNHPTTATSEAFTATCD
jgi:hypothetical protein